MSFMTQTGGCRWSTKRGKGCWGCEVIWE